jgi:hypothetical protein
VLIVFSRKNREEYNKPQHDSRRVRRPTQLSGYAEKREEDDPFGSREAEKKTNLSDRRKKSHFKAASRILGGMARNDDGA